MIEIIVVLIALIASIVIPLVAITILIPKDYMSDEKDNKEDLESE